MTILKNYNIDPGLQFIVHSLGAGGGGGTCFIFPGLTKSLLFKDVTFIANRKSIIVNGLNPGVSVVHVV